VRQPRGDGELHRTIRDLQREHFKPQTPQEIKPQQLLARKPGRRRTRVPL
jgi:hypothetical protein